MEFHKESGFAVVIEGVKPYSLRIYIEFELEPRVSEYWKRERGNIRFSHFKRIHTKYVLV